MALIVSFFFFLFFVAIRRDSGDFIRFSFLIHVHFLSCKISLVCCLKYSYSCFSSNFCFLVIDVFLITVLFVLFLVAVISLSLPAFMYSSSHRIDASTLSSMLVSSLPRSFCLTYSLCRFHLLKFFPSSTSRMVPSILQDEQPRCLSL